MPGNSLTLVIFREVLKNRIIIYNMYNMYSYNT